MGFRSGPFQQPGQPILASTINSLIQGTQDLSRAYYVPHYGGDKDGFWAVLSGSSSPYSWTTASEDISSSLISWTQNPNGATGTNSAYEINGISGLDTKTVWIEPGQIVGRYQFQYSRQHGTAGEVCFTSVGCPIFSTPESLPTTISVYSGSTLVYTGSFNGGTLCISLPSGSYTYAASACNFTGILGSFTFSGTTITINIVFSAPVGGYSCWPCVNPCGGEPVPDNITLTSTAVGICATIFPTATLAFADSGAILSCGTCGWIGSSLITDYSGFDYYPVIYPLGSGLGFQYARYYPVGPGGFPACITGTATVTWVTGSPGNSCCPFSYANHTFSSTCGPFSFTFTG
jgi:hypothetical protein